MSSYYRVKDDLQKDHKRKEKPVFITGTRLQQIKGPDMQDEQRKYQRRGNPLDDSLPVLLLIHVKPRPVSMKEHRAHAANRMKTGDHNKRDRREYFQFGIVIKSKVRINVIAYMDQQRQTRQKSRHRVYFFQFHKPPVTRKKNLYQNILSESPLFSILSTELYLYLIFLSETASNAFFSIIHNT